MTADLLLTSMALGLMVAGWLWVNEFPDCQADKAWGRRNLVVQMGIARAKSALHHHC